jgi:flagellin-like protein
MKHLRGKKGITPIIATILLLMMTVAVAGAAFFWLTRIQGQLQGGTESYQGRIFQTMASSVDVVDANYDHDDKTLTLFFHNTGNTEIPVDNGDSSPTTTWILRDSTQVAVCSTDWSGIGGVNGSADCTDGCGDDVKLGVGEIHKVILYLYNSECDINADGPYPGGTVFNFVVDFSGVTTTAGSFVKTT